MAERLSAAPARLARRARHLYGYWRSERRTLRRGTVALALSTCAGFVAGLVLGSITGTLERLPGLLVLIPASVGMRGTIFGAMGARLGTGIAAGHLRADPASWGAARPQRGRGDPVGVPHVLLPGGRREARGLRVRRRRGDLVLGPRDDLRRGRRPRLGDRARVHGRDRRCVVPSRVGPGRGVNADGHRDRRHGHAAEPVRGQPGHEQRHRGGRRRRALHGGDGRRARRRGPRGGARPPDPARDGGGRDPRAAARHLRRRAARGAPRRAPARARRPDPDPAVRLPGGRARWDPVLPAVVEAAARRDHARAGRRSPR